MAAVWGFFLNFLPERRERTSVSSFLVVKGKSEKSNLVSHRKTNGIQWEESARVSYTRCFLRIWACLVSRFMVITNRH